MWNVFGFGKRGPDRKDDGSRKKRKIEKRRVSSTQPEDILVGNVISGIVILCDPPSVDLLSEICLESLLVPVDQRTSLHEEAISIIHDAIDYMRQRLDDTIAQTKQQIAGTHEELTDLETQKVQLDARELAAQEELQRCRTIHEEAVRDWEIPSNAFRKSMGAKSKTFATRKSAIARQKELKQLYDKHFVLLKHGERMNLRDLRAKERWNLALEKIIAFCDEEHDDPSLKISLKKAAANPSEDRTKFDDYTIQIVEYIIKFELNKLEHQIVNQDDAEAKALQEYEAAEIAVTAAKERVFNASRDVENAERTIRGIQDELMKLQDLTSNVCCELPRIEANLEDARQNDITFPLIKESFDVLRSGTWEKDSTAGLHGDQEKQRFFGFLLGG
eukprot:GEMP01035712.1.p1 GENE.GEMP01035712.1~~GEMP01035712.1.p1  ORF type:complete len:389 (+),score=88.24 GEMP01035712.1:275-1441(+)